MTREEAAKFLNKEGYITDISGNLIMITIPCTNYKEFEKELEKVRTLLHTAGYENSFGAISKYNP